MTPAGSAKAMSEADIPEGNGSDEDEQDRVPEGEKTPPPLGVVFLMKKDEQETRLAALKSKIEKVPPSTHVGLARSPTKATENVVAKGGAMNDLPHDNATLTADLKTFARTVDTTTERPPSLTTDSIATFIANVDDLESEFDSLKDKVPEQVSSLE